MAAAAKQIVATASALARNNQTRQIISVSAWRIIYGGENGRKQRIMAASVAMAAARRHLKSSQRQAWRHQHLISAASAV